MASPVIRRYRVVKGDLEVVAPNPEGHLACVHDIEEFIEKHLNKNTGDYEITPQAILEALRG